MSNPNGGGEPAAVALLKSLFVEPEKLPPSEQMRRWRVDLRVQDQKLELEIAHMTADEQKLIAEVKKYASNKNVARILAKSVLRTRNSRDRIVIAKGHLISLGATLGSYGATLAVAKNMERAAVVMKDIGGMMKIPQLRQISRDMSREMQRIGMLEEQIDSSMEQIDDADADQVVDQQTDTILSEILGTVPSTSPEVAALAEKLNAMNMKVPQS